jgi:hypothetical protein
MLRMGNVPCKRVDLAEGRCKAEAEGRDILGRVELCERLDEVLDEVGDGRGEGEVDVEGGQAGV